MGTTILAVRRDEVEAVFRAHYGRLVGLARLLVDDPGQAEEVVQDAFVSLYRRWGEVDNPPAYLRTAVVNGARGRLRQRVVARRHLRVADPVRPGGPDDGAVLSAEHLAVAIALRALPGRQRACIALRFYEDLTEAEIAATLGISTGSVKTHVHRGMAALATALEDLR